MDPNRPVEPSPGEPGPGANHHTALRESLSEIKDWVSGTSDFGIPHFGELGTRLLSLKRVLSRHFCEEEAGGFLKEPLEIAPRFQREAEVLLKQHGDLTQRIDHLSSQLQCSENPFASWQEAVEIFDALIADIEEHERHETAIFQSAFEDDLGAGD